MEVAGTTEPEPQPAPRAGPYHAAWFDNAHSEQAMRMLEILPASERVARGRPHLFRMWENAPRPNLDGMWSGQQCHCVVVDRYGSIELCAGGMRDRKMVIAEYCEPLVEIEPGLIVAHVKDDTWELPHFKKAAKEAYDYDAAVAVKVNELKQANLVDRNQDITAHNRSARRRFFDACGHMIMTERNPKKLDEQDLIDILVIAELNGATFPTVAAWMEINGQQIQTEPETKPYDPVAFLAHCNAVMSASGIERRKFSVELDASGRPIESTRKRIA